MYRWSLLLLVPVFALFAVPSDADTPKPETFSDEGFIRLDNGKDLTGWIVSAKSGHSRASKNKSGGKWEVVDGAIVGSQDIPGNGGIIITEKQYGDFEVALQMRNDDGPDSGLFLRSTDTGKCYQAMIDYHKGGNLMGIYGEGLGGVPHIRNFDFGKDVTEIVVPSRQPDNGFKCPVDAKDWKKFWHPGEWQDLRARIVGNPPTITTWINGVKFMEYTEPGTKKRLGDTGGIALQVHGGGDWTKSHVRYKNIRVKELSKK